MNVNTWAWKMERISSFPPSLLSDYGQFLDRRSSPHIWAHVSLKHLVISSTSFLILSGCRISSSLDWWATQENISCHLQRLLSAKVSSSRGQPCIQQSQACLRDQDWNRVACLGHISSWHKNWMNCLGILCHTQSMPGGFMHEAELLSHREGCSLAVSGRNL